MAELPKRSEAFFDWYNEVLELAQVTDKRYPIKGLNVWPPFGQKAMSLIDRLLRDSVEALGYEEVSFPTLIPETEFQKESDHIKGFEGEVYWVTHGGTNPLDIRLCLRPTSETAMYPMFALWVRSHKDLPLRTFQIVNVFRYETKMTRPLIRVREVHFFEGHTVQLDEAAATRQVADDLTSFAQIAERLALPYLAIRRPEWDKFPGAHYSIAFDTTFAEDRTLQLGTVHHYRDNFARPYGIQYETPTGERAHAHQTTYGLSERLLGAVVGIHGDDKGLVLPPAIAPVQVVVIPVPGKADKAVVEGPARALQEELSKAGLRAKADLSDERPGAKYYRWESRGVPLRVELGPREVEQKMLTLTDRLGGKRKVEQARAVEEVRAGLDAFHQTLLAGARKRFREQVARAGALDDLKGPPSIHVFGWCGKEACGHKVEEAVAGALLGTLEAPFEDLTPAPPPACLVCGAPSVAWAASGRPL